MDPRQGAAACLTGGSHSTAKEDSARIVSKMFAAQSIALLRNQQTML